MKRIIIFSILVILYFISSTSFAINDNDYIYIGKNDNGEVEYYFNPKTLDYKFNSEINGFCVDVWVKTKFIKKNYEEYASLVDSSNCSQEIKEQLIINFIKVDYDLSHYLLYNCKFYLLETTIYDKNNNIIVKSTGKSSWEALEPHGEFIKWYVEVMYYFNQNEIEIKERLYDEELKKYEENKDIN